MQGLSTYDVIDDVNKFYIVIYENDLTKIQFMFSDFPIVFNII